MAILGDHSVPVRKLDISVYTIPTEYPESDGTYEWNATTMVMVQAHAGGRSGLGYTYADESTATLIDKKLRPIVENKNALDVTATWHAMQHQVRNLGRPGIAAMAISAVDNALWDLKARLLDLPLVKLLGQVRESVPIYGSGGFTSYSNQQLQKQLAGWVAQGIPRVKMKVGRDAAADPERVIAARKAIGEQPELFVDANGAYTLKEALKRAQVFAESKVHWFEEPVLSEDLDGLHFMRDRTPAGMDIAAGEYGYTLEYFRRMLDAQAVDVLQADCTRCLGITGFLYVAALCQAHNIPLSAHCAPAQHTHAGAAAVGVRHLEYFHDHVRIENMLLDGAPQPRDGGLCPDLSRPGMGLELKRADARRYAA